MLKAVKEKLSKNAWIDREYLLRNEKYKEQWSGNARNEKQGKRDEVVVSGPRSRFIAIKTTNQFKARLKHRVHKQTENGKAVELYQ